MPEQQALGHCKEDKLASLCPSYVKCQLAFVDMMQPGKFGHSIVNMATLAVAARAAITQMPTALALVRADTAITALAICAPSLIHQLNYII